MIDLVGDHEQVLDKEQAVMDNHEDKVAEIIERLQELRAEAKAALSVAHSTDPSHHLRRWLNDVKSNLHLVKEEVDALKPGPGLDSCLILQLQRGLTGTRDQTGSIHFKLTRSVNTDRSAPIRTDPHRSAPSWTSTLW